MEVRTDKKKEEVVDYRVYCEKHAAVLDKAAKVVEQRQQQDEGATNPSGKGDDREEKSNKKGENDNDDDDDDQERERKREQQERRQQERERFAGKGNETFVNSVQIRDCDASGGAQERQVCE